MDPLTGTILFHVAAVVLGLRVFHLLIFKQHVEGPGTVALWLVATWGLVVVGRRLARRSAGGRSRGLVSACRRLDGYGLALAGFFLILLFLFHFGYDGATSDGRDYFVQARSIVVDRDLDLDAELAAFPARGLAPIYPIGTAVLWVPFHAATHAWLGVLNLLGAGYERDGYAMPYQVAVGVGTVLYGFVAFVLIARVLRCYFSPQLALATVLALCGGTFLLWYLAVESSMTHGTSLFATTLFLYLWHQTRQRRTVAHWAVLGGVAGLMAMVRWADVLFILLPALEAIRRYWGMARQRDSTGMALALRHHGVFIGTAVFSFSPQLLFWRIGQGGWLAMPADRYNMGWGSPQVLDVLFSPNHGLLSWTPLLYLAVLGLPLFIRRAPAVGGLLTVGFLAQLYIHSIMRIWWGGSAFGARRFASSALVFAVGLASMLGWLRRRPTFALAAVLGGLVLGNVFFMQDVRRGRLPSGEGIRFDDMFASTYARIGNPFSFPANVLFAWRHGTSARHYDELGLRVYDNPVIDLGEEGDDRFLTHGWSGREREGTFSFRWGVTRQSGLVVPLRYRADYVLELRAQPFVYQDAPPASLVVEVNGRTVAVLTLQPSMATYQIPLSARHVRRNLNGIRFHYEYATSPRSLGLSDDPRLLAVRFDVIRLQRQP